MIQPATRPVLRPIASAVDVAIVGAGAAGIAAARALLARGLTVAILEARDRVGGRLVTATFGGHPVDLGAHWLHAGRLNPLVRMALAAGRRVGRAPAGSHLVIDGRTASADLRRAHGQAFERADAAFARASKQPADRSLAAAMPPLGRFGAPIAATMALVSGRPLSEVSTQDFPSDEFGDNYFAPGGYGTLVSGLARDLPVALGRPVTGLDWSGDGVRLSTPDGDVRAKAALVTAPVGVLGRIVAEPGWPDDTADAIATFRPGTYEHVILRWPSAPFRGRDRLAKVVRRGLGIGLMTWMDGAPFHYLELDHDLVRTHATPPARAAFARAFLRDSFGARATADLAVVHATDWLGDPFARGSWAVIPPGGAGARLALARPVADRVWFAGEATSRAMWGTAGGAWEEGERAAAAIADRLA